MKEETMDNQNKEPESNSREDLKAAFLIRLGLVSRQKALQPNVDNEWERFLQKKQLPKRSRRHTFRWIGIGAAAACLCFVVWYTFFTSYSPANKSEILFRANTLSEVISIQKEDGSVLALPVLTTKQEMDSMLMAYQIGNDEEFSIVTPRKHSCQFTLPDGSEVWLNAESRLEYRTERGERVASLQGEAYFHVARDTEHPFIVLTEKVRTRVLGTQFNVRNYSPIDTHVTLIDGSVQVSNTTNAHQITLRPGEDAQLKADGSFLQTKVDVKSYISWKDGYFYFDNVELEEILRELGRWYNVSIEVKNTAVCQQKLHYLANRNQSLDEAISLLNLLNVAHIEKNGENVIVK